ncbi:lipid-A-disaccharide synthase [Rhizobium halophytocola]|uniref:Lipid-A-disaccharide synthase n=1 Tax=Rhizobium halophytocola TaxID=735519 RepID=A0ABS4DW76_9HYPH|nr:lipid-A-disaccharide synthase [Rhizobium halophytocola]MBP1849954.1 lipid-A-disaccharide synthase [Rhizobium halophytocola]
MTTTRTLKIAIIAGEVSGDLLGGDLIQSLKSRHDGPIELMGVGGEAMRAQGLEPIFDVSELSVMGFTAVLKTLPKIIRLINETVDAVIAARPDLLIIIDSPDFTHRVAKKVRKKLPDLPVVDYVCPSVWAWKEYRAPVMRDYVDLVLAVLPFEPEVMERLGGPKTHFVGHRLSADEDVARVRAARAVRPLPQDGEQRTLMLLPGSRGGEIRALLPVFGEAALEFINRNGPTRLLLPTVPRQEQLVREMTAGWRHQPEIMVGPKAKWDAFEAADMAIAASGTVILELALAGIPVVSAYKADWIVKMMTFRIKIWTAALPNLVADYAVVPEYINAVVRPGSLVRWAERLTTDTLQRKAMLAGFDTVLERLQTDVPPGEKGAALVLDLLHGREILPLS